MTVNSYRPLLVVNVVFSQSHSRLLAASFSLEVCVVVTSSEKIGTRRAHTSTSFILEFTEDWVCKWSAMRIWTIQDQCTRRETQWRLTPFSCLAHIPCRSYPFCSSCSIDSLPFDRSKRKGEPASNVITLLILPASNRWEGLKH